MARARRPGGRARASGQGPFERQQGGRNQRQAQRAGDVAPQLVGRHELVAEQVELEAERSRGQLGPAEERRQRGVEKQRQRHRRGPRPRLAGEGAPGPGAGAGEEGDDPDGLPHQIGQREGEPQAIQPAGDGEQRLEVDVAAGPEGEQIGGEPAVRAGVAGPGQVLELVGAEDAVGADQPVGAGELGMQLGGVDQQQHQREQRPAGQGRQQHDLGARDSRPSIWHGGQD